MFYESSSNSIINQILIILFILPAFPLLIWSFDYFIVGFVIVLIGIIFLSASLFLSFNGKRVSNFMSVLFLILLISGQTITGIGGYSSKTLAEYDQDSGSLYRQELVFQNYHLHQTTHLASVTHQACLDILYC